MDSLTQLRPHEAQMNGQSNARPPDARGSRIASRTPWLDLPEPFDNLEIRAWLDYPQEVAELWTAPKDETPEQATRRVMEACKAVFLEHRGTDEAHAPWEDEDGVLPAPDTDEFWQRIPTPLGRAIMTRFFEELTESPLSRASRRRKRKNFQRR